MSEFSTPTNTDECSNLVSWILNKAGDPDKPVLIDAADESRFVTQNMAAKLYTGLVGAFEEDNAVCLHLPNDVLYPVLMLGVWGSRCRWTGSNTAYTAHELKHHISVSKSKYVITLSEHLETVRSATCELTVDDVEIIMFSDILQAEARPKEKVQGLRTVHDLLDTRSADKSGQVLATITANDIAALQSTSGTTGLPKMAIRTHGSFMRESAAIQDDDQAKGYEVRRLFCTPVFHAFSTPEVAINSLRCGLPTYIMKRYDDTFAQKVHKFEITEIAAPPPILLRLQQQADAHPLLQGVRKIFTGGAPLSAELRSRALEIFDVKPRIIPVWGMTEGGWFTTFRHGEDDTTGSVGKLLPGFEVKVITDPDVKSTKGQVTGELLVRSKQVMTGYFENDKATKEAFDGDWLKTGDVGYVRNAKVYLIDRKKDLIKVNGFQVAPAELEGALFDLACVGDSAAISAGSGTDEYPLVFVVLADKSLGEAVALEAIKRRLQENLAHYKWGKVDVKFVDSIPRNPSGKILRKQLREQAKATAKGWL